MGGDEREIVVSSRKSGKAGRQQGESSIGKCFCFVLTSSYLKSCHIWEPEGLGGVLCL